MSLASSFEKQMLALINQERASAGVGALKLNVLLNDSSEDHSRWMINTDIFSHTGQNGSSPGDRMESANYPFEGSWTWGENIAWQSERGATGIADDVVQLHQSLMNSPGHRANILKSDFTQIGIGIERGDIDGYDAVVVTQNFARTDGDTSTTVEGTADPTPVPRPLVGGQGDDVLRGGDGDDKMKGNAGSDRLLGGNGEDTLHGGSGNDDVRGGGGNDVVSGGKGNDRVLGNAGVDTLYGGKGNDTIQDTEGRGTFYGNKGNDRIESSDGVDWISGGNGNDTITSGGGNDTIIGNKGFDTFIFYDGFDVDRLRDMNSGDRLRIDDALLTGQTTGAAVVAAFGDMENGRYVLDFGGGDKLLLDGVTDANALGESIDIF